MYFVARYGTQSSFRFPMVKRSVVDFAVSADWTPATGDTKISIDGGNVANTTNNPSAIGGTGSALWTLTLTATELTGNEMHVQIVDSATKVVEDQALIIRTLPAPVFDALYGGTVNYVVGPVPVTILTQKFDSDATSHAVTMPTLNAGDGIVVVFGNDGSATVTTPAGWRQLSTDANSTIARLSTYCKIADGTESGGTVDFVTSATEQGSAIVYRFAAGSFYPSAEDGFAVGTAATGTSTTPDPPSVTPAWGSQNVLYIPCFAADDIASATAYPTNYSSGTTIAGTNATGASVGAAQRLLAATPMSAPAENPGTFTIASQEWIAQTIAVRPLPEGVTVDPILHRGTAQAGAAGTVTFAATASTSDDYYNDAIVSIYEGAGAGQARFVSDYVGSTRVASIAPNWITNPGSTSKYVVVPSGRVDLAMWLGVAPNALVSSRVDASVGAVASNAITAAAIADGAIDLATFASDVKPIRALAVSTADSGTKSSLVDAALTQANADQWVGQIFVPKTAALLGQNRIINAFDATNDRLSFSPPLSQAISTDDFEIWPGPGIMPGRSLLVEDFITTTGARELLPHASIFALGKRFVTYAVSNPTPLNRFNNPSENLRDYTATDFASDANHNYATAIDYSETTGLLYVCFSPVASRIEVDTVDPTTLTIAHLIQDTTHAPSITGYNAMCIAGSYIYVLTWSATAHVLKYNLSDGSFVSDTTLTGLAQGHAISPDQKDNPKYLIATGDPSGSASWLARIQVSDMSFTSMTFDSDQQNATDHIAIMGDNAFVTFEAGTAPGKGSVSRVQISDLTKVARLDFADDKAGYHASAMLGSIWVAHQSGDTARGVIIEIDPETLFAKLHVLPTGMGNINDFTTDGTFLYFATFSSNARHARCRLTTPGLDVPKHFPKLTVSGATGEVSAGDSVWDELRSGHVVNNSFGQLGRAIVYEGADTYGGAANTIQVTGTYPGSNDTFFMGGTLLHIPASAPAQFATVKLFTNGSPATVTTRQDLQTTPDGTGRVLIFARAEARIETDGINQRSIADGGLGSAQLDATLDVYNARITLIDDDSGTTDRYVVNWYKNGQDITTGITNAKIRVVKESDGTDLIAETGMTEIGSTQAFKYDATGASRIVDGAAYFVVASATIDGSSRTHRQGWGRDS